ncbi:MAG TPA: D-alanyl-D-alanine carboxypeptidase family protein [Novosphingobium sp.]|nr:D-alanyl-D-alanine carboxypeptidase family protein [Novosphingobium sp.]
MPPPTTRTPIGLLVDLSAGQTLYARNAEARMIPASMTKAMSALVAFDLIKAGKLRESDMVTVRPQTAARWAGKGTSLNLRAGEQVSVHDLLRGLNTVSANDAAVVLAEAALGSEAAWTRAMNRRAQELGMNASHFATSNGWPDGGKTYVTARDMVRPAQALIVEHPELYRRYIGRKSFAWRGAVLTSHDPLAEILPGADGIKTGFTSQAGYTFLGAVQREGRRLILVIGRAPSESARALAATELAEWGYARWDSRPFLDRSWIVGAARVQDGAVRQVPLSVARPFALTVPKGTKPPVAGRIIYSGPLRAPIGKGTVVAGLQVHMQGQPDHFLPLVATRDVARAGPIDRLRNGLLGLLE